MPGRTGIRWFQRTRTRLTTVVALAIVVPILTFHLMSERIATGSLLSAAQGDLEGIVEHASFMLSDFFNRVAFDLLHSLYDPEAMSNELYLSLVLHRQPAIEDVSLASPDGKEKARVSRTTVYLASQLRDLSGETALRTTGEGGTFFSDPFLYPGGDPRMIIAVPLFDRFHRFSQMLMAEVSLRRVFEEIGLRSEAFQYVYIVDDHGIVIAHTDFSLVLKNVNFSSYKAVSDTLALPRDQTTPMMRYVNVKGREVVGLGTHNKELGWGVMAEVRTDEALAGVKQQRGMFAAVFASSALLGVIGSLYIGSKASRSVLKIQKAAQDIGEGRFLQRVEVKGSGELESLAANLNDMAARLQEYHNHMKQDVEILNEKVAERTQSLQQAYEELKERDRQLTEAQSALVQAEKLTAMGQLVAGVVHEVSNPLTYVSGNVSILRRDLASLAGLIRLHAAALASEDPGERERLRKEAERRSDEIDLEYTLPSLERVCSEMSRGLEIIRKILADLRDFSRMGEVEREPCDLNSNIEATLSMVAYDLRKNNIEVSTDLGEIPSVECSPVKINQVLLNIILNAIQAISQNGHIWITTGLEGDTVVIRIRDDGPGIPEEIIGKVFDPFFTTRPPGQGTGLGLSVSYGIVRDHDGRIDVQSKPGAGTEFTIGLPVTREQQAPTGSQGH